MRTRFLKVVPFHLQPLGIQKSSNNLEESNLEGGHNLPPLLPEMIPSIVDMHLSRVRGNQDWSHSHEMLTKYPSCEGMREGGDPQSNQMGLISLRQEESPHIGGLVDGRTCLS